MAMAPSPHSVPDLSVPPAVVKKRRDFLAAAASGKKCGTKGLLLQIRAHDPAAPDSGSKKIPTPSQRFGLTASKRVGNAVRRNRAKRRLRALANAILPVEARSDCDYILVARPETVTRAFDDLRGDLRYALRKLGALRQP